MHSQIDADSQEITRVQSERAEVRALIRQRQDARVPPIYGISAGLLGAAAVAVWAVVVAYAAEKPPMPVTRAYAAALTLAAVLGVAASAATVTYVWERGARARTAAADRIREYDQDRLVRAVKDAMAVFIAEGDASAGAFMAQAQHLINGTEGGNVRQFRGRN